MEMSMSVKASCNWNRIGGCELSETVQTRITHEDVFIKPDLDEIIQKNRALLLSSPAESDAPCELQLLLQPSAYKVEALTLVCTAPKLELFLGPLREYAETAYGSIAEDGEEGGEPFSYRYDIEIEKSGIVEMTLKLLTSSDEICVFGVLLQVAPNPNGITTASINLENVQKLLGTSAQKLSPSAEKCMLMMQHQQLTPHALLSQFRQMSEARTAVASGSDDQTNKNASSPPALPATLDVMLKRHIDQRLEELESRITARLETLEQQQSAKLDAILEGLQSMQSNAKE